MTEKLKLPPGCVWAQGPGKTTIIIKDDPDAWLVTEAYQDGDTEVLLVTNPDAKAAPKKQ
jgi:hypothetical protein